SIAGSPKSPAVRGPRRPSLGVAVVFGVAGPRRSLAARRTLTYSHRPFSHARTRPVARRLHSMAIQKVGVVGCGLMGSGIAQVSAAAGFPTVVLEVSQPLLDKGLASIKKFLQGGVDKGKLAAADMEKTLANLKGTTSLNDLAGCDLVVEAVSENLDLKRELFAALDGICGEDTVIASNTSSLSITELSTFSKHPERVIGLHFFNPV